MFALKKNKVRILSIDGGGIRGIIPALILKDIQRRLRERKNSHAFHEIFDLIAGTSTGALIAASLTMPGRYPHDFRVYLDEPALEIDDMVNFYLTRGKEIFPPGFSNNIRAVAQVFREKYSGNHIESILEEICGSVTLADCLTNLLIPCYDTERGKPYIFQKKSPAGDQNHDLNFYMKDVCRAASAVPSYFTPAKISPVPSDGQEFCLIDGGVFASNPAMCAYMEARKLYPRAKEFVILSIGTGTNSKGYSFNDLQDWGYVEWLNPLKGAPLIRIMLKGQSECVNNQLQNLPGVKLFRINGNLNGCSEDLDDASEQNLQKLQELAGSIIKKRDEELDLICKVL